MILYRHYMKTNMHICRTKEIIKLFLTLYYKLQLGINSFEFADDLMKNLIFNRTLHYPLVQM